MRRRARQNGITLDMTAMCDMAFLLLTFFMLATQFKKDADTGVIVPTSISETPLPTTHLVQVEVQKDGRVSASLDKSIRRVVLEKINDEKGLKLPDKAFGAFERTELIDCSIGELAARLARGEAPAKAATGIPYDTLSNELQLWLKAAVHENLHLKFCLKADQETDYSSIERITEIFQDLNINKIRYVTRITK
jgi:biopolymer transport protein ExbD